WVASGSGVGPVDEGSTDDGSAADSVGAASEPEHDEAIDVRASTSPNERPRRR
ncbi:MAG: hypothetical protein ACI8XD_000823, partial [Thermoproteota archaeon]